MVGRLNFLLGWSSFLGYFTFRECKSKMGRFLKHLAFIFHSEIVFVFVWGLTNLDMICLALVRLRNYMTSNKAIRFQKTLGFHGWCHPCVFQVGDRKLTDYLKMDWSWKGSLCGAENKTFCPRDGHDWWWQALGMDKALWKRNTILLLYATIHYPFSHNHGSVENHPTWKETNYYWRYTHFFHGKNPWLWERVAFSLLHTFFHTAEDTWGTSLSFFFHGFSSGETRILWREVSWHVTLVNQKRRELRS